MMTKKSESHLSTFYIPRFLFSRCAHTHSSSFRDFLMSFRMDIYVHNQHETFSISWLGALNKTISLFPLFNFLSHKSHQISVLCNQTIFFPKKIKKTAARRKLERHWLWCMPQPSVVWYLPRIPYYLPVDLSVKWSHLEVECEHEDGKKIWRDIFSSWEIFFSCMLYHIMKHIQKPDVLALSTKNDDDIDMEWSSVWM